MRIAPVCTARRTNSCDNDVVLNRSNPIYPRGSDLPDCISVTFASFHVTLLNAPPVILLFMWLHGWCF